MSQTYISPIQIRIENTKLDFMKEKQAIFDNIFGYVRCLRRCDKRPQMHNDNNKSIENPDYLRNFC